MEAFFLNAASSASAGTGQLIEFVQGNWGLLAAAVGFIIIAIILLAFLKQIIINSVLGIVAWAVLLYVFQVKLNFWVSLIASLIFGLAGIGVLLLLHFFGISI